MLYNHTHTYIYILMCASRSTSAVFLNVLVYKCEFVHTSYNGQVCVDTCLGFVVSNGIADTVVLIVLIVFFRVHIHTRIQIYIHASVYAYIFKSIPEGVQSHSHTFVYIVDIFSCI